MTSKGNTSMELPSLEKGEFDHTLWVTMTEDGPVVANLLLDGILDDDPVPKQIRKKNRLDLFFLTFHHHFIPPQTGMGLKNCFETPNPAITFR